MFQMPHECYPYGVVPVSKSVREHYATSALSQQYPLPDYLPRHHPLLQALEGIIPVQDALPPWWAYAVCQADPCVQPLLRTLSIDEFREGHIEEQRWRAFCLQHPDRSELPRSPKIAPMLPRGAWRACFEDRGSKETPRDLDLILSSQPEHLLNMSNGQGWMTCLHLGQGERNHGLPGSLYDTGMAVAMLTARGADIWAGSQIAKGGVVLARTSMRLVFAGASPTILFGCVYDNNATLRFALLARLLRLCEQRGLSWGVGHWSLQSMLRYGYLGPRYHDRLQNEARTLFAEPFWLPSGWCPPYIDAEHTWQPQRSGGYRLAALGCLATSLEREEVEHA